MNYGPASKYYDLFSSKNDRNFYKELAIKEGRKALELGVGTGRVAIELAKAGVTVLGIDNSQHMLNVARRKLRKESITVRRRTTLELGDMRNFKTKESFPFIYIASSTFEHCTTKEDQRRCLISIYQTLKRTGTRHLTYHKILKENQKALGGLKCKGSTRKKLSEQYSRNLIPKTT